MIYNNEGKKLLHFYIGNIEITKVYVADSTGIHLVWGLEDCGKTIDDNGTLIPEECDHNWEHDKYWMDYFTWYSSVYNYEEDDLDDQSTVPYDNNETGNYIWVNNTIWNNNNIW